MTLNPRTQQYHGFAGLALFFFLFPNQNGADFASVKLQRKTNAKSFLVNPKQNIDYLPTSSQMPLQPVFTGFCGTLRDGRSPRMLS
jgi:hypothetical protein